VVGKTQELIKIKLQKWFPGLMERQKNIFKKVWRAFQKASVGKTILGRLGASVLDYEY
jgi:hypothetical protein